MRRLCFHCLVGHVNLNYCVNHLKCVVFLRSHFHSVKPDSVNDRTLYFFSFICLFKNAEFITLHPVSRFSWSLLQCKVWRCVHFLCLTRPESVVDTMLKSNH